MVAPTFRRMTTDQFFTGFVAALRDEGVEFVDTRDDVHHSKFRVAVDQLTADRRLGKAGALGMPRTLMPTQVTGRYRELDDAFLNLQRGLMSAPNPFYPGIELKMSRERAERILETFEPEQRKELRELAR